MPKKCTKEAGASVTVMLAMMLLSLLSLLAALFSTARLAGTGYYVQTALDSSLDSAMSRYHREVWDNYRIFLLSGEEAETLAGTAGAYFESYMESGYPWQTADYDLQAGKLVRLTDADGKYFETEVCDYMKTGAWKGIGDPGRLADQAKDILEAGSYGDLGLSFHRRNRKILNLEKAVDEISENLARQKEFLEDGIDALKDADPGGFFRAAGHLYRELDKLPGLVEKYEKKADALASDLEALEAELREGRDSMSARDALAAEEELKDYHSYVSTDGERRSMVRGLLPEAEENRRVLSRAETMCEDIEEWYSGDDDEDEDDDDESGGGGDDEEEDEDENPWEEVIPVLREYRITGEYGQSGKRDKKKIRMLEDLSSRLEDGLLGLVLPDGAAMPSGRLSVTPLREKDGTGKEIPLLSSFAGGEIPSRLLLNEYGVQYFSSYVFPAPAGVKEYPLRCQQEYLLFGKEEEKDNLSAAAAELLAVREGFNLAALLSDGACRAEAEAAAAAITAASGFMLVPLERVLFYTIMTVWSLLESAYDVRALLAGKRVSALKRGSDFKVSLASLLEMGAGAIPGISAGKEDSEGDGFTYTGWIRFLMLTRSRVQLRYRMMDLISENMVQEKAPVRMRDAVYRAELIAVVRGAILPVKRISVREY